MKFERSFARERTADRAATAALVQPNAAATRQPLPAPAGAATPGAMPLPSRERERMEAGFGHDFSAVRVHASGPAAEATRSAGARAVTYGTEIAFAPGEWAPGTRRGQGLLAHELAHVAMQAREGAPQVEAKEKTAEQELAEELPAHAEKTGGSLDPSSPEYARTLQGHGFNITHDANFELLEEPTDEAGKKAWKRRFEKANILAQRIISESGPDVEQKESRAQDLASDLATAGFVDKAMALAGQLTDDEQKGFVYDAVLKRPDKATADNLTTIAKFTVARGDSLGDNAVMSKLLGNEGAYAKRLGPAKVNAALKELVPAYASEADLPGKLAEIMFWDEKSRAGFTKMMLEQKQGKLLEAVSSEPHFVEGARIETQAGGETTPSGATLAWAVANKQKVLVEDIVALGSAAGVTIKAPAKTDIVSLKAWLNSNTEKIGEAVQKQHPNDPAAATALLARIERAFMYHVDPGSGEDIKPSATGQITHLVAGGPAAASQLKVDCDVLATYGVRMLLASGFTPVGYMAVSPTDEDRAKHAMALVEQGGKFTALSNMSSKELDAKSKEAALEELRDFGIAEAYDPGNPLTEFSIYYADSDAKGSLPNSVLNMEASALRADLGK